MPNPVSRRLLRRGLVAAGVVAVLLGGAAAFIALHSPGNVSHPSLQFTQPTTTTAPAPHVTPKAVDNFQWPWFGFNTGRTRAFDAPAALRPPLHVGWHFFDGGLLEFPPVIYHEAMYVLDDDGSARGIDVRTGKVLWHTKVGTLSAASPAVAPRAGVVLMPVLSVTGHSPGDGRFVALSMKTGRIVWSRPLGAGSESSPIVNGRTVYYGDQGGTLYARDVADGRLYWVYHAAGAIKGGPALVGGILYFGDYAGRAYAVRAVNGAEVWAVGTDGARFGFGSGEFYSTPAVAFGRVYMGNTDGRVYSFGARTGALAWATGTGAYVYASPAVADPAGLGPTVYIGSYDGSMYAFNAQSGAVRWSHPAGGKISGSATVIGNVLYYSDLATKSTAGLNVVTGRQVFSFPDGAFTPVIADFHAIYLDGTTSIYQMLPTATAKPHARPRPARRRRRRTATRARPQRRSGSSRRPRRARRLTVRKRK
ncbi:MAG: PQQ-binding-like beta-propeller repeat protein [Solirubrobacteraceae bacterium]